MESRRKMTITVSKIRTATKREWDRIWYECDYATFFHSREWAEIWQDYTTGDFQPFPFMLKFSDGTRALLPLTLQESEQIYFSSPAGTYGGLISLDTIDSRHLAAAAECSPKAIGRVFIRTNPFAGTVDKGLAALQFHDDETHVLYLNDSFEIIYNNWSNNHKTATKRARRDGIIVKVASSLDSWQEYYAMYESSLDRWGNKVTSRYNWALFESIFNRKSSNIKLWIAFYREKAIAGSLCFYSKKHVVYWHGSAYSEYFNLKPVQLIFYEAISEAVTNGFNWFDFNPSGGHEGVKSFKKGFGAAALSCPWIEILGYCHPEGWRNNLRMRRVRLNKYLYEHNL